MKRYVLVASTLLLSLFSIISFAGWQVAARSDNNANASRVVGPPVHEPVRRPKHRPAHDTHVAKHHHYREHHKAVPVWKDEEPPMPKRRVTYRTHLDRVTTPSGPYPREAGMRAYNDGVQPFGKHMPLYAVSISGSLKENLERIMGRYHWKVVWKVDHDYNFDGRITGDSLPKVVEKLLEPFPLQAVMYMSNRTLTVVPRVRS